MSELKPCPFCGGEARITICMMRNCVACTNCGCAIIPSYNMNEEEVTEEWNRRSEKGGTE